MPRRDQHLDRADANVKLAQSLGKTGGLRIDWAITMLFYSALHYIDAYLAPRRAQNHDHRDALIERNGSICVIYKDYRRLKDMSQQARYEIADYAESDLGKAEAKLSIIKAAVLSKIN